ncbi:MAG: ABC transporter permease [Arcobacter sp.]|nr:MAG: ABC transporter permease [Arcobacter sp.]
MTKFFIYAFLIFFTVLSPFAGTATLDFNTLLDSGSLSQRIFLELRLPRILLAFVVGGTLALAGLLFQTLFRNALMTPFTLGVSGGAVLGAGIAIKLGVALILGISAVSIFGFIGALSTVILLIVLSRYLKRAEQESLLLLGIALSFFYTSALMVIFYLSSFTETATIMRFTMGSLSIVGYESVIIISVIAAILVLTLYFKRFELQIIAISDEQASLKGINTKRLTYLFLVITSLAIGVLVSLTGPIGFIGLIIPHMIRKLYQKPVSELIFPVFFLGGLFLLACDTLARFFSTGSEIPIGVITALIGGPFFIYLIISKQR